jgi:hypothetical protein
MCILAVDVIWAHTLHELYAQATGKAIDIGSFLMHKARIVIIFSSESHTNSSMCHGKSFAETKCNLLNAGRRHIKVQVCTDAKVCTVQQHWYVQPIAFGNHSIVVNVLIASVGKWQTYHHSIIFCQGPVINVAPTVGPEVAPCELMIHVLATKASKSTLTILHVEFVKRFGGTLHHNAMLEIFKPCPAIASCAGNPVLVDRNKLIVNTVTA